MGRTRVPPPDYPTFLTGDEAKTVHHPSRSRGGIPAGKRGASVNRRKPGWSRSSGTRRSVTPDARPVGTDTTGTAPV